MVDFSAGNAHSATTLSEGQCLTTRPRRFRRPESTQAFSNRSRSSWVLVASTSVQLKSLFATMLTQPKPSPEGTGGSLFWRAQAPTRGKKKGVGVPF